MTGVSSLLNTFAATTMVTATAAHELNPLEHVVDKNVFGTELPVSVVMLVLGGVLLLWLLFAASKRIQTGPESEGNERYVTKGRMAQLVEMIVVGLQDQMLIPVMGERTTRKYLPFLLTLFFFILVLNIFGLFPLIDLQRLIQSVMGVQIPEGTEWVFFGGTATANIAVTGALAICAFVAIQRHAFKELGFKGWLEHLCGGKELLAGPKILAVFVVPIVFVVEFLGLFIKPAALAIRLFANMVGGHTLLATLLMFGAMALKGGLGLVGVGSITLVAGVGAILISFLELFVAVLQAFIFMFLTAVFISMMSHHDEEHAEEHGHGEGAGHDHAAEHGNSSAAAAAAGHA